MTLEKDKTDRMIYLLVRAVAETCNALNILKETLEETLNELGMIQAEMEQKTSKVPEKLQPQTCTVELVPETVFLKLSYNQGVGAKLGPYEITYPQPNGNDSDWKKAYSTLDAANASINHRYTAENYVHTYWLHENRIFRQKKQTKNN